MAKKTALTLAVGAALAGSLTVANAAENPFAMKSMEKGYMLAYGDTKAKEGKCGGEKAKEAKCGGNKEAKKEEMKPADKKMPEGKCGEGKCGGTKK
ncbi:MAG: hypothetical protein Q8K43_03585 [Sulfurimicrobium sp.]|jgi:uncharacterized low-complexity protein|nr:hypothetical protein [Sulfurimicrobium sp.]MDO9190453.1 hypothetical protein [Sulfurimicrobium sp.]MDP1896948.1 hypothetical protein [Sulfurimicrobium sp.]MDP2198331.1 hypothetical protein [Sulfurimicrobium sp.]MDP2963631.1 hypothetical protein [Sulfurimicrobium sp.]